MTSKSPARSCDDMDDAALSYAEVKALAAGNPMIKEKMDLDVQVTRLRSLKAAYNSQKYRLEDALTIGFPRQKQQLKEWLVNAEKDADIAQRNTRLDETGKEIFSIVLAGKVYDKRDEAGRALLGLLGEAMNKEKPVAVGTYRGFEVQISYLPLNQEFHAKLVCAGTHDTVLGSDAAGNTMRLSNLLNSLEEKISGYRQSQHEVERQIENARVELAKPFAQENELGEKSKRLAELDALLNVNNNEMVPETDPPEEQDLSAERTSRRHQQTDRDER